MKPARTWLAATLLAAAASASAQPSTVTLFGIVDVAAEVVSNVGASGSRLSRVPTLTGSAPSRLGLRVSENLGGGLVAFALLEMGIGPDGGTLLQGGRAWGRQAFVGLGNEWGQFSLGRQYTMLFYSLLDSDILGANLYGSGSLDAGIPNARHDNSVVWRKSLAGWSLGASYSWGRDVANAGPSAAGTNCPGESASDARACRGWSLLAKYATPTWSIALADERQRGRTPTGASDIVFGGLTSSAKIDRRLSIAGHLFFGPTKIGGGVIRRSNDGDAVKPDSELWYLGAAHPLTRELTLDGAWMTLRYKRVDGWDATLLALRCSYAFSHRTSAYLQGGHISNQRLSAVSVSAGAAGSNPAAGRSQSAFAAGVKHVF